MTNAFGGLFTSRLNMNLREDKHWAYGAFSFYQDAQGQRPFMLYAPVQTDKTADSMKEMLSESQGLIGDKPLTAAEIGRVKANDVRGLPGEFESTRAVLGSVQNILVYHRPDDYIQTLKARIEAQKDADVEAAAREVVKPNGLTWVVVGDRKQIEKSVRELKLGDIEVLDADGNVVR